MSYMKQLIDNVLNCDECNGTGIVNGWVSPDGDYDFDWCDCNPYRVIVEPQLVSGN